MSNPDPIAFSLFGHPIAWYGVFITCAVMIGAYIACKIAPKYGWTSDNLMDVILIGIPSAVVGARLYFIIFFDLKYYIANPSKIFKTWEGGLAIYGGIIGAVLACLIYCKVKKRNLLELLDIVMPSFALGQAIGRWGNFFNQEAFGPEVTNPAHMWFPMSVFIERTGTIHYATFFYESAWCLLVFIFLMTQRKKFKHSGDVLLYYAMLYGFERMFIEGLRTDSLVIGSLRVSQILSGVLFFGILIFMIVRHMKEKNQPELIISNKLNPGYNAQKQNDESRTMEKD